MIKTALLSFGMSGRVFHAPFLCEHPQFELVSCWERSTKSIQNLYPNVTSIPNLESILNDPEIELVIVNTPIYTHYEFAKAALLAGKHIVVEKAFTSNSKEAEELEILANQANKHIFVYQNRRLDSDFLTVKKVLNSGKLGKIVDAEFHFDRFNAAQSPKLHKEIPGPGAGIVKDLGPHIIDQALHLFGKPTAVFADLRLTRPETQVEDYFDISLFYPEVSVRLKGGYFVKHPIPSYQLHGHLGSFLKIRADRQEPDLVAGKIPTGDDWGKEDESEYGILDTIENGIEIIPSEQGNYMAFYQNAFQTIRGDSKPFIPASEGKLCMQVIDASFESSRQGKKIHIQ